MIRAFFVRDGELEVAEGIEALRPGAEMQRCWVDVSEPTEEEARALVERMGLHELAVEDALRPRHPPKLEDFGDVLFLIAHTPSAAGADRSDTRKMAVFLAKTWLVTIRRTAAPDISPVEQRVRRDPARHLGTPDQLAHLVLDHLASDFDGLLEDLFDSVEELEDAIYARVEHRQMDRVSELRQQIGRLQRTVRAQRDVVLTLTRTPHAVLSKKVQPYLRDVYDHMQRVHELAEGLREGVHAARDAYFSAVNTRVSEVMRTLTVIATIMMPLSFVSGVFGMNFDRMPGLDHPAGFWAVLGLMAAIAAGMLLLFRRRGWL